MKNYKILLAGLALLLVIIFIGVFVWLLNNNLKNTNPLPIVAEGDQPLPNGDENSSDTIANNILYLQAENEIQVPLDDVIVRFESRYPRIQVLAKYVPKKTLLNLPKTSISDKNPSPFLLNVDIIIANDTLTQNQLAPLQLILNKAQDAYNRSEMNASKMVQDGGLEEDTEALVTKDNNKTRELVSFSYALKEDQAVSGVVLTDNPTAVTFRNFLVSSTGQDILKHYNYDSIDGYKSNMDDLFNTSSRSKDANGEDSVDITKALKTEQ